MPLPGEVAGRYKGAVSAGASLDELYARYGPGAKRLAYLLTGDPELAQDIMQDAFARIIGRFGNLQRPERFEAYLRETVVNLVRRHWRRRSHERHLLRREVPPAPREHDVDMKESMWQSLLQLPPRQRTAVVLRYYEDLPERDVAQVMGCSVGAARQLVSRGVAALRVTVSELVE